MGTLQKLKAYFGMVPADEYDGYDLDDLDDAGYADDYDHYPEPRRGFAGRRGYEPDADAYADRYDERETELSSRADFPTRPAARPRAGQTWSTAAPVQGSLAVETRREPVSRPRPVEAPTPSATSGGYPMGRIVTLHPTSFAEARAIGEHYRDGTPVIMNLTELEDADARRLVDFAAGLAFAMRGSMDKVTNKVFLISPPNQDPTAEDKRRIAEGGLLNRT
jgi:cell division inhibitor SepF